MNISKCMLMNAHLTLTLQVKQFVTISNFVLVCSRTGSYCTAKLQFCAIFALKVWDVHTVHVKKGKGSPYSIIERRVLELIPVIDSQPAGDVSHKPGCRLPLLSARPAVTLQPLRGLLPSNFEARGV